jgi:hypothetical protein
MSQKQVFNTTAQFEKENIDFAEVVGQEETTASQHEG